MRSIASCSTKEATSVEKHRPGVFFQPKLTVGTVNDVYEQEADAIADQVMRMSNEPVQTKTSSVNIQRKCAACEKEEDQVQRKEKSSVQTQSEAPSIVSDAIGSSGTAMDHGTRSFMESRFGYDFSNVKIHTDAVAARSAQAINALAYTSGNSIVFNEGQYAPDTQNGKRLLAHELTHVVQQNPSITRKAIQPHSVTSTQTGKPLIQRTVRKGNDYAGSYEFDDQACALQYNQDWYFQFPASMNQAARNSYMTTARDQVNTTWSHKHKLRPTTAGCPCHADGVNVSVNLNTHADPRNGRRGYSAEVHDDVSRAHVNPLTSTVTLDDSSDQPKYFGASQPMPALAHEFGHTIDNPDEYNGWAGFWDVFGLAFGANDRDSLMHRGDQVRPRHYHHFADLISNEIEGCIYSPEGSSSRALANPVVQLGLTGAFTLDHAEFILDLHIDRRLGNSELFGLFTPRLGFNMMLNAANGNVMTGPTLGLNLNRLAHPLYVDMRTGVLYDPEDPGRPATLNIPLSATAGLRGNGFSAGVNYTGLIDVLGNRGYTHMVGLNLQFDLGGSR